MEYRIQRLKEDLTSAQQRNKRQRKQLANYTNTYKNKCNECNKYKQVLTDIRTKLEKNKDLGVAAELDYYVIRKDILKKIDEVLGDDK